MDILSAIFRLQNRKIGVLVPSVVVSEKHSDGLEITEHPVETGAAINDHAYRRPSEVVMECGFAGGGQLLDFSSLTATSALGKSPAETYAELLDLIEQRSVFDVTTGKRTYKNMLLKALEVTTDRTTENVLSCTLTLREVILTQTHAVKVAPKENMTQGVATAEVHNAGTKAVTPVKNTSLLSGAWDGAKSALGF